jgi:uncharacterized protein
MERRLWIAPGVAVVVVVAVLAVVNVVDIRVVHGSLVMGPICVAGLVAIARLAGLSWGDLGLGPGTWWRGIRWAGVEIAVVAVVVTVGAALPPTRGAFRDSRYRVDAGHALLIALIYIPIGTVLLEEVAFRGVLWGLLRRLGGTGMATMLSSALFGLWHVLPARGLATHNEAIGGTVGRGWSAEALIVLATVLFTALAGVVFCELRRRSGSILAPAGLHWATNALGVLASAAVWAWGTR